MYMKRVALYFGSFNPVHRGHTHIAQAVVDKHLVEALWFVPSPQSPFKSKCELVPFENRLDMLRIATKNLGPQIQISEVENGLPKPNYSVATVKALEKKYPHHSFSILIGGDNVADLPHWRQFSWLNKRCEFIIFPREKSPPANLHCFNRARLLDEDRLDISSSQIRQYLQSPTRERTKLLQGLEEEVLDYINERQLYRA